MQDELNVRFVFTQNMLNRSDKVYFRVCEEYTGPYAASSGGINVYSDNGCKHKIDYKIILKWTPRV